jgi:hypothetical protein
MTLRPEEEAFFTTYDEYQTCQECKTRFHFPTLLLAGARSRKVYFVEREDGWVCPVQIGWCTSGKKQPWKLKPENLEMWQVLEGLQELFRDYVNLKAMEQDFVELNKPTLPSV